MLEFLDYVQQAFFTVTNWNRDNSYGSLNATTKALLDFPTPTGLSFALSSLASPNFATSYSFDTLGALRGNISYLYSSRPLHIPHRSYETPLRLLIPGYRQIQELRDPAIAGSEDEAIRGPRTSRKDTLVYGRLFLPRSHLEALYLRRLSTTLQLKISAVSSSQLRSGGSILFLLSQDRAKHTTEYLYSTDSALLGFRGLYNFGPDPRESSTTAESAHLPFAASYKPKGRFSAGAEVYYGLLNKSGGISTGFRFATLPQHTGFPYTMTLTVNPLMGNLTSTYAVKAGSDLTLGSKFDFNVYSYESGFQLGMELWRRKNVAADKVDLSWVYEKLAHPGVSGWGEPAIAGNLSGQKQPMHDDQPPVGDFLGVADVPLANEPAVSVFKSTPQYASDDADIAGVVKARINQDGEIGVLWEGRLKELLYTFGVHVDFKQRDQIFRGYKFCQPGGGHVPNAPNISELQDFWFGSYGVLSFSFVCQDKESLNILKLRGHLSRNNHKNLGENISIFSRCASSLVLDYTRYLWKQDLTEDQKESRDQFAYLSHGTWNCPQSPMTFDDQ